MAQCRYGPRQSKSAGYSERGRLNVQVKFAPFSCHKRRAPIRVRLLESFIQLPFVMPRDPGRGGPLDSSPHPPISRLKYSPRTVPEVFHRRFPNYHRERRDRFLCGHRNCCSQHSSCRRGYRDARPCHVLRSSKPRLKLRSQAYRSR